MRQSEHLIAATPNLCTSQGGAPDVCLFHSAACIPGIAALGTRKRNEIPREKKRWTTHMGTSSGRACLSSGTFLRFSRPHELPLRTGCAHTEGQARLACQWYVKARNTEWAQNSTANIHVRITWWIGQWSLGRVDGMLLLSVVCLRGGEQHVQAWWRGILDHMLHTMLPAGRVIFP